MTDEMLRYQKYMREALKLASEALGYGEVPVGALVVRCDEIISGAYNLRENKKNALLHAETEAIYTACEKIGGWRLSDCELYVTLEPCPMCAGAIVNSRIKRVIFGAKDFRAGAFGSVINLNAYPLNHKPEIVSGILADDCLLLLKSFFDRLR